MAIYGLPSEDRKKESGQVLKIKGLIFNTADVTAPEECYSRGLPQSITLTVKKRDKGWAATHYALHVPFL